ncbi:MAG: hypothetical protein SFV32_14745 [Opitutaceae bacterium]|nr:hypothetical protein [Opitutaceae bacterium]
MTLASFRDRLLPIALSQAAGLACGIIGVRLTTKWVAPEAYGHYGVFFTLASLGMWVMHAGVIKGVNRLWAGSAAPRALLRESRRAMLGRRAIWFLVLTLGLVALTEPERWPAYWPVLAAAAFALSAMSVYQGILQATRSHWADLTVTIAGSATRSLLPPLAYAWSNGSGWWMRLGFLAHALTAALVSRLWVHHQLKDKPPEPAATNQLSGAFLGRWFLVLSLAHWALNGINRWVAAAIDPAFAGHFTLASNIAMIPTSMFGVIVLQFFQPGLYSLPHDTTTALRALMRRVDLIAVGYTVVAAAGIAGVRWLAPLLVGTLIDEKYLPSIPLIAPAGAFILATLLTQIFQLLLLASRREAACGPVEVVCAATLITGCVVAAKVWGTQGFQTWLYLSPLVPWLVARAGMRRRLEATA